jgi:hypothetical protein
MEVGLVDHELVQGGLGSQRHLVAFRIILRVVTQVLPCYPVLIPNITHPTIKHYSTYKRSAVIICFDKS